MCTQAENVTAEAGAERKYTAREVPMHMLLVIMLSAKFPQESVRQGVSAGLTRPFHVAQTKVAEHMQVVARDLTQSVYTDRHLLGIPTSMSHI